jgi:hypothetical protein
MEIIRNFQMSMAPRAIIKRGQNNEYRLTAHWACEFKAEKLWAMNGENQLLVTDEKVVFEK